MNPDQMLVNVSLQEAEYRRWFWLEAARYATDKDQAKRFEVYSTLLVPVAEDAMEWLRRFGIPR